MTDQPRFSNPPRTSRRLAFWAALLLACANSGLAAGEIKLRNPHASTEPRPPVVLVHGYHASAAAMLPMQKHLEAQGWQVCAANLAPSNGAVAIPILAAQLAAFIDSRFPRERTINLVAFSMGGIVARYYAERLGGAARLDHLIMISSPNHGTKLVALSHAPGCQDIQPASRLLDDLNRRLDTLRRVRVTTLWTPFDITILPARSCRMPIGHDHRLLVLAHPLMIYDRRSLEAVASALAE